MKRQLLVTVDCGEKTCDGCHYALFRGLGHGWCAFHNEALAMGEHGEAYHRLDSCLTAERRAKEVSNG